MTITYTIPSGGTWYVPYLAFGINNIHGSMTEVRPPSTRYSNNASYVPYVVPGGTRLSGTNDETGLPTGNSSVVNGILFKIA